MAVHVYPHELIGKEIEVIESKNKSNLHLKGKVIDETKNTLVIQDGDGTKTLMKENIVFRIIGTDLVIKGETINKRPEERTKGK